MARLTPIRLALLQDDRSQKWLAEQAEVNETAMSRIVNGQLPSDVVIARICEALGRSATVLFPHLSQVSGQIGETANATRLDVAA
jgi:transcriptional regulator with XRE-family HTH domain